MALNIKNKFGIEERVFHKGDPEQQTGFIVFIQINPNGLLYGVSWNGCEPNLHFEIELTKDKTLFE
jgi:hypothetical protein